MKNYNVEFKQEIIVSPSTDSLGPYEVDFLAWLPQGRTILTTALKAYQGQTETTQYLIEPGSCQAVSTTKVQFKLQWPVTGTGQEFKGNHKLVFEFTFDNGSADEAHAGDVLVRGR